MQGVLHLRKEKSRGCNPLPDPTHLSVPCYRGTYGQASKQANNQIILGKTLQGVEGYSRLASLLYY
jgi:hypothetical protein